MYLTSALGILRQPVCRQRFGTLCNYHWTLGQRSEVQFNLITCQLCGLGQIMELSEPKFIVYIKDSILPAYLSGFLWGNFFI
jgi:hypothetical protein